MGIEQPIEKLEEMLGGNLLVMFLKMFANSKLGPRNFLKEHEWLHLA